MKAFVVPNFDKAETASILHNLTNLAGQMGLALCIAAYEGKDQLELLRQCDVIISIGGDGTIIHCSRLSALSGKPIMGINAGKLGFLAQVEPSSLGSCLRRLTSGDYNIDYRSAISATFTGVGYAPLSFAINDIVITKSPEHNIATLEMRCNGKDIDSYRADGLVFSTSTGSTAYNLSAGGPVIDPLMDVITLAPICPHSLSARTMVFSQKRVIAVTSPEASLVVIADGSQRRTIDAGTTIHITAAEQQASFVSFHEQEFFEILTTKIRQRG